jgi:hypothetical protein
MIKTSLIICWDSLLSQAAERAEDVGVAKPGVHWLITLLLAVLAGSVCWFVCRHKKTGINRIIIFIEKLLEMGMRGKF